MEIHLELAETSQSEGRIPGILTLSTEMNFTRILIVDRLNL